MGPRYDPGRFQAQRIELLRRPSKTRRCPDVSLKQVKIARIAWVEKAEADRGGLVAIEGG